MKSIDRNFTPPKIIMLGQFFSGNLGDLAIYEAMKKIISEISDFYIEGYPIKTPQFVGLRNKYSLPWFFKVTKLIIVGIPSYYIHLIVKLKRSNLVIIGGGNLIIDYTILSPIQFLMTCFISKLMGKKIFICGIGAGPIKHRTSKFLYRMALKLVDKISVRDKYSFYILSDVIGYRSDRMILTADPAFAISQKPKIKKNHNLIGISTLAYEIPSHNVGGDRNKYNKYIRDIAKLIDQIIDKSNSKIRLIPTEIPYDIETMEEIYTEVMNKQNVNLSYPSNAEELITSISGCDVLIGTRMHSMVLALTQYVPIIGLSKTGKIESLFNAIEFPNLLFDIEEVKHKEIVELVEKILVEKEKYLELVKRKVLAIQEHTKLNSVIVKDMLDRSCSNEVGRNQSSAPVEKKSFSE